METPAPLCAWARCRSRRRFVRANTLEKHGPVRAVRFPRIARWRHDKTNADADTLETVRALLKA